MEIVITVLATIIVLALIVSVLFNLTTVNLIQKQSVKIAKLETMFARSMQDQQQIGSLFIQFITTLNHFAEIVDDFGAAAEMGQMGNFPTFPDPFNNDDPWNTNESSYGQSFNDAFGRAPNNPPSFQGPQLSDAEIKKLHNLLTNQLEDDEPEEDVE